MKKKNEIQGKKIKQARVDSGLTQKQLSIYLGLDQSMVSKVEKGERVLDLGTIEKVSELFCIPSEYFIDDNKNIYDRKLAFRSERLDTSDLDFITTINRIVLNQIKMDEILEREDHEKS